ncbi:MAG: DUF2147 domain-containing protein [Alphaproteobacteria bacterium]|nr:DUF2147 domain-containing protein [Alphaproteobacteria bacterium]
MKISIFIIAFLIFAGLSIPCAAQPFDTSIKTDRDLNAIYGLWQTADRDGVIELLPCNNRICGSFFWVEEDGDEDIPRDSKNPDPDKRDHPLCGMQFMGGFTPNGHGQFESGWIYSPNHGQTFSASMNLIDENTLVLRGYFLIPLFGESQTWTRATNAQKCRVEPAPSAQPMNYNK